MSRNLGQCLQAQNLPESSHEWGRESSAPPPFSSLCSPLPMHMHMKSISSYRCVVCCTLPTTKSSESIHVISTHAREIACWEQCMYVLYHFYSASTRLLPLTYIQVTTVIRHRIGVMTWLLCCLICWITGGCWILALIPCCLNCTKDVVHFTPTDGKVVGVYKRC